jgi:hypothetical protein
MPPYLSTARQIEGHSGKLWGEPPYVSTRTDGGGGHHRAEVAGEVGASGGGGRRPAAAARAGLAGAMRERDRATADQMGRDKIQKICNLPPHVYYLLKLCLLICNF